MVEVKNDSSAYHREVIQIYARPALPARFERLIGWEALALEPRKTVSLAVSIDESLLSTPGTPVPQILPGPWTITIKSLSIVRHSQEICIPVR
jgi:hypothetical protein